MKVLSVVRRIGDIDSGRKEKVHVKKTLPIVICGK